MFGGVSHLWPSCFLRFRLGLSLGLGLGGCFGTSLVVVMVVVVVVLMVVLLLLLPAAKCPHLCLSRLGRRGLRSGPLHAAIDQEHAAVRILST